MGQLAVMLLSNSNQGYLLKNTKVNPKEQVQFFMLKDVKELGVKQSNEKVIELPIF